MAIDSNAFRFSSPEEREVAQALLGSPQTQQNAPANALVKNEPIDRSPAPQRSSQEMIRGLEDRIARANQIGARGGFGALGAGIANLILQPKLAEARRKSNETQVKAEDLQLEKQVLANERAQNSINAQKIQVNRERGIDALSRLETKTSENLMEDVRLAGGELNENGTVKTNLQKLRELGSQGEIPFDLERVVKFNPGLLLRMNQTYSRFTSDGLIRDLNQAGTQERLYTKSLTELERAKIRSRGKKVDPTKALRDNFKAYQNVLKSTSKMIENLKTSDLANINPGAVNEIVEDTVVPAVKALQDFGTRTGVITPNNVVSQKDVVEGVREFYETGSTEKLDHAQKKMLEVNMKASKVANQPATSPNRVKDPKAPAPVATSGNAPSKKEQNQDALLESILRKLEKQ